MNRATFCRSRFSPQTHWVPGFVASALIVVLAGCSNAPSRVKPPSIRAGSAASDAMGMYDSDGDGYIAGSELDAAPALRASLVTLDTNSDQKVDKEEITARIESWQEGRAGVITVLCTVLKGRQPVEGATVTFEPESFLGGQMRTAVGETGMDGAASPSIPKDQRLTADAPRGLQLGFYKVRISKIVNGKETIPEKYNTATTLGQQIAGDDPAVQNHRMVFSL